MLKYLLLAAGCFSLLSTFSQEYSFRRYTPADGLAADDVHDIMQDSYGFLWIGTGNGLSRFDGKTFKNYAYTEGLRDLTIIKIYEDSHHRLWVGTTNGIAELKNGRFVMHTNPGNENFLVYSFSEAGGNGLVAFTDKGAYRYNGNSWIKTAFPSNYSASKCLEIVAADDGLYLNYEDAVFFKKNDGTLMLLTRNSSGQTQYFCAQLSKIRGTVYAAIHNQLFKLAAGKMHLLIDSLPVVQFFNFTVDTGNICWITIAGKGLYKYRLQPAGNHSVSFYEYDANTAGYPFTDNQQNLWITSYVGLIKVMPGIFVDITPPVQRGATKRPNVIPARDNEVIVSDAGGLHLLKKGQVVSIKKPVSYKDESSYRSDVVEGFAKDSRQFTWMITRRRKILCWNGNRLLDFSHLPVPRNADYIRNITVNPVNNTVFICDDSTLLCGNEKSFGIFTDRIGKQFSKTTTVLFTRNGIGIVNVFFKGIYFITRQNEIIKAPPELDIIDKGSYTYFFEDREGWIWISNAGKGLVHFRIDENSYGVKDLSILTTESGLPSNKIVDMTFDSEGNKWVSCSNGLAVLKHAPSGNTWDVYPLGKEQNLQLVNPPTMAADNAGNVWLASMNGIVKVDTRKLVLKKISPAVVIEKVLLNMKETDWQQLSDSSYGYFQLPVSPRLHYAQNTLGFEFSGISVYNADYFEYSYQLAPLDKTWSAPSSSNFIALAKLSPGKYVFKVKVRGRGTAWSVPAVFSFSISPPFWDSWLFRILLITLAAAIIISLYFNRIRKIQRKAEIQNQLRALEMKALKAQMNPHFIYNALNSIQSLIADEKKTEAINYIGTFSRLLRHVLEYTENNVISLEKELQTLKLYIQLESLRLNIHLVYSISTADDLICENEKLPPLILQPFVENALWHGLSRKTGEKILHISVAQNGGYLTCTIEDNGIGRASAAAVKKQQPNDFSSKGIDITVKRLLGFNMTDVIPVIYQDLYDSQDNASGTRVIISIKRNTS